MRLKTNKTPIGNALHTCVSLNFGGKGTFVVIVQTSESVHSTLVSVACAVLYWSSPVSLTDMTNSLLDFASPVSLSPLGDESVLACRVLNLGGHTECDGGHCPLKVIRS